MRDPAVRRIAQNGVVAALYYSLTLLFTLVPDLSQFGPTPCRFSEALVLFAFFKLDLTVGYILFMILSRNKGFMHLIGANRHLETKF